MVKLEVDTVLHRVPDLDVHLDSSNGLQVTTDGRRVRCGRHGLAILEAFSRPTPLSEALVHLQSRISGPPDDVDLAETIEALTGAGVLRAVTRDAGISAGGRMARLDPFSWRELLEEYEREHDSISKHLLTIYSIIVGLNAQRVVEIGVGGTTRTIRAALARTGGELYSCDVDRARWESIVRDNRDPRFQLRLEDSRRFIPSLHGPFDFVLHDGAHDFWQVAWDLEHLWPLVRQFGIIGVHDTQHNRLGHDMQRALTKGFRGCAVSWTHLPYSYGLTIVRIEREQPYEPVEGHWNKAGGGSLTAPATCGVIGSAPESTETAGMRDRIGYGRSRLRTALVNHPSVFRLAKLVRDGIRPRRS